VIFGRSSFQPQVTVNTPDTINLAGTPEMKLFKQKATIANAFGRISIIKTHLLSYYMDEGQFPQSLDQIGISSDFKNSKDIDQIVLRNKGSILIKFKESVANNLILKITPIETGNWIEWNCETNFIGHLSGCDKVPLSQELFKKKR